MAIPAFDSSRKFWHQRHEAALNWVALGMLLAAWNACDNGTAEQPRTADIRPAPRRPPRLNAHPYVSVRAYKGHEIVNEL